MIVINLFGEAGSGKSATASGVYNQLAISGIRVELVTEVAKGYAWESMRDDNGNNYPSPLLKQQLFILGEQNRQMERLRGKRDIIILECPLIMGDIYQEEETRLPSFRNIILEQFNTYNNVNILLERGHNFDPIGRVHNENEAAEVREKMINFLNENNIEYHTMRTNKKISYEISKYIRDRFFKDVMLAYEEE